MPQWLQALAAYGRLHGPSITGPPSIAFAYITPDAPVKGVMDVQPKKM